MPLQKTSKPPTDFENAEFREEYDDCLTPPQFPDEVLRYAREIVEDPRSVLWLAVLRKS